MAQSNVAIYKLTVRPHRSEDGRFEYVLSSPGCDPLFSNTAYATYAAAKDAGEKHGHDLGLSPSPSAASG